MNRKQKKVAAFIFLERSLRKVFNVLKIPLIENKKINLMRLKREKKDQQRMISIWKLEYIRNDIEKRISSRKVNKTKYNVLKVLEKNKKIK